MIKKIYKRLESTNSKAQEIIESDAQNSPLWIQAHDQFQGRGLGANTWISDAGKNITGSLVVYPKFLRADQQFEISIIASLAVKDLLNLFSEDVKIKWPNDLLAGSRKIAGLLVEHAIVGEGIKYSIIGIGLNVNQELFPDELRDPVSLKQILQKDFDLDEIADLLLDFLEARFKQLENGHFGMIREDYLHSLFRYKEYAPYKSNDRWFRAKITGVDPYGQLILETESGEIRKFGFKEVEFID